MKWGEGTYRTSDALFNNPLLLVDMKGSLRDIFVNISNHRATGMNPFNTESWMLMRDSAALKQSRATQLNPYVDYCDYLGSDRPKKFSHISKDPKIQKKLEELYGTVDRVEFWTGLIASDNPTDNIMSDELTKFVANDAFNQALTHPLLSENVWSAGEQTFGKYGWSLVKKKQRIADILERNTKNGEKLKDFVGMTRPGSRRRGINLIPVIGAGIVVAIAYGIGQLF